MLVWSSTWNAEGEKEKPRCIFSVRCIGLPANIDPENMIPMGLQLLQLLVQQLVGGRSVARDSGAHFIVGFPRARGRSLFQLFNAAIDNPLQLNVRLFGTPLRRERGPLQDPSR